MENCRSVGNQGVKRITDSLKNLEVLNLKWCNNVGDEAFYSIALDLPNLLTLNLSYTKVGNGSLIIFFYQDILNIFIFFIRLHCLA